jgi:hypothetical protein
MRRGRGRRADRPPVHRHADPAGQADEVENMAEQFNGRIELDVRDGVVAMARQ